MTTPVFQSTRDSSHLFRCVTDDAAKEGLLQIRDDLARADDHSPQGHHLVDMLRIQVPQRLHLTKVEGAHLCEGYVEEAS